MAKQSVIRVLPSSTGWTLDIDGRCFPNPDLTTAIQTAREWAVRAASAGTDVRCFVPDGTGYYSLATVPAAVAG